MEGKDGSAKRRALGVSIWSVAVVACLTLGGAARADAPARCVSLDVPSPFILPDGTVHPAGGMRLCLDRNLNPVTGIHRVYVEGAPAGYFMSRASKPEAPRNADPLVLFYADAGRLRLVGYTVTFDGKMFSYRLQNSRVTQGPALALSQGGTSGGLATVLASGIVLTARLG